MERSTLPYEIYFCEPPSRYIHPMQSKYHNLGQHGYLYPMVTYTGKRGGFVGDWGPRQAPDPPNNYPYPLDFVGHWERRILGDIANSADDILCIPQSKITY